MTIERKSYSVAEMKVADDQAGVIEAIVSVFSNVDQGNEKVMPGFFSKSIEKKLPKGVWAHDWKQPIAKTLEAKELLPGDPQLPDSLKTLGGAYIKGQFNLDTQRGREAYSDIKFGIVDEFSIGYAVLKDGKDKETGARELIEGDWKEWSPVLVGMNDQTRLISIKEESGGLPFGTVEINGKIIPTGGYGCHTCSAQFKKIEEAAEHGKECRALNNKKNASKGMLAEELAITTPSFWETQSAACRLVKKIMEAAKSASVTGVEFDWRAKISALGTEFGTEFASLATAQGEEFLNSSDDEFYLKGITGTESFESFEAAGTALTKFTQSLAHDMRRNHDVRVKEGRMLSSSNRAKVQSVMDRIMELHTELTDLMAMSEPLPKEKAVDVEALRTQSMRLVGLALDVLSR